MLLPDPEIPDLKMLTRARNAVLRSKRAIGIRGFRGLVATIFCNHLSKMFEPRNVVLNIVEFSEMSAWLGLSSFGCNLPGPGVIVPKNRPPGGPIAS
jgi:hypothetical protein